MKLKNSYKVIIAVCFTLITAVVTIDTNLVNLIATIGGGVMEKAVHIIHFNF